MEKRNTLFPEETGIACGINDPAKHFSYLRVGIQAPSQTGCAGVFVDGACKDHTLLFVAEERDVNEEDGEELLAVVLVPRLLYLNGDVVGRLLVLEGEDCATSEEEGWECEWVNVRSYHCVVV